MVPTGVAIALPDGYAAFVHPRSGLAHELGVGVVNAPGTVDAGYRGEIKVLLVNHDATDTVRLARGDRIAQLVVQRVERARFHEVELLPGSARGEGGHGSTGGFAEPDRRPRRRIRRPDDRDRGVSVFRKKRQQDDGDDPPTAATTSTTSTTATAATRRRRTGGDRAAAGRPGRSRDGPVGPRRGRRPGGRRPGGPRRPLAARAGPGIEVRVEADQETGEVVAVTLVLGDGAAAAPAVRRAAQRGHLGRGARRDPRRHHPAGRHGRRGRRAAGHGAAHPGARSARPTARQAVQPARFLGVDGPRWFLRGVLTGRPRRSRAGDRRRAGRLFRDVVVVRGDEPDGAARPDPAAAAAPTRRAGPRPRTRRGRTSEQTLEPFERGPEITEIH